MKMAWAITLIVAASCGTLVLAGPFEDHEVVPDLIPIAPVGLIEISYPTGVSVDLGNELTPTQVRDEPSVSWESSPDKFYTLAFIDPDVYSRADPSNGPVVHWLVGNIQGDDVASGDAIAEYIGSGPPQDTGLHRYVFLVYEQTGQLSFDETRIPNTTFDGRMLFQISEFVAKYNLGDPLAGNFFQAQFDDYVPTVLKLLGL